MKRKVRNVAMVVVISLAVIVYSLQLCLFSPEGSAYEGAVTSGESLFGSGEHSGSSSSSSTTCSKQHACEPCPGTVSAPSTLSDSEPITSLAGDDHNRMIVTPSGSLPWPKTMPVVGDALGPGVAPSPGGEPVELFGLAPVAEYDFIQTLTPVVLDDVSAYLTAVADDDKAALGEIEAKREKVRAKVSAWPIIDSYKLVPQMQEVPIHHSVLYFGGRMYQAPSLDACRAMAAEVGGREIPLGIAVDINGVPYGNLWDMNMLMTMPTYLTLSRLLLWRLFDDRFATGEWGAEMEAELRAAVAFDVLNTALMHLRPTLLYSYGSPETPFHQTNQTNLFRSLTRSEMIGLMWDGAGRDGLPLSTHELDTQNRGTVCVRHVAAGVPDIYPWNMERAVPKPLFFGQTLPSARRDLAYTIRAMRRMVLTRGFGAYSDELLPMVPKVTLISRRGVPNKHIEPWVEFVEEVRAISLHHKHSFEIVEIGSLDLKAQLLPFYNSRVVVITTGAAMVNTLFMRRASSLLMLWEFGPLSFGEGVISLNGDDNDMWFNKIPLHIDETWRPYEPFNVSICHEEQAIGHVFSIWCVHNVFPPIDLVVSTLDRVLSQPMGTLSPP
ncbi:uncharacterized protein AMSG_09780 [Thecamonas trahens ATCC 50062]|uniref:Glycosyltransferase 61 catalytic domain-containing protein n=1 Tax=Thecamonas trahens ATCC 50062 TaxID=461836 RepID=A0A0L0DQX0_THETB|nr:hypothetical protein AMSG_09780 [Thecamonas trahens ATCC 50062]KNC53833.1 hypothetical protein AMSG_09780 [Thecamonas trahens ATCC 50062]|eukprot:XP_013754216.1 hypothetical protein AMSG_09780 [Thecamonas trahens ATCC 50062]